MLRRLLAAAVAVLSLLVPASTALASGADVIRDCAHNGRLTKTYTQKEYHDALAHIPADVDEYTDCRSVIRRAELSLGSGSSGGGGGGTAAGGQGTSQNPFAGANPQEVARAQQEIAAARKAGGANQRIAGSDVTPGALAYHQIRSVSKLPTPLLILVILIVLGAAGLSANLFRSRRDDAGHPGA
jgi:hypothetical protein